MKSLVIVGGGAAGLMAANGALSQIKDSDLKITLIEKNSRPARKVMITGKGRCNVTNNCDLNTLIENTVNGGKFLYSAFSKFLPSDTVSFFENLGVPLKTERGNRVFPLSDKAVDIVDALYRNVKQNCNVLCGRVSEIITENNIVKGVKLEDGGEIKADAVILATGGMSYPLTGSTGDGYIIAKNLGHTVTELKPSLVGLECHEGFCSALSGLTLKNVTLKLFKEGTKKPIYSELGEMLFTHIGISGPLTLSASARIKDIKFSNYTAVIDLKPALDQNTLDKRILRDYNEEQNKDFQNSLDKLIPKSLIPVIVGLSGIPKDKKVNQISKAEREKLVSVIKNLTLHITDYRPIEEAVVTSGGIELKEISPHSMESKIVENLYFAGEIMDVDAYTGGFNLQIAFSTGHLASASAVKKLLGE